MHIPGIYLDADQQVVLRRLAASHGQGYRYIHTVYNPAILPWREIGPRVGFNQLPTGEVFFTSAHGSDPE